MTIETNVDTIWLIVEIVAVPCGPDDIEPTGRTGSKALSDGDRFFSRFTEYVTAGHAKYFILALCKEFEEDLTIVLDGAPYFQASAVTDLSDRDDLAFVTLSSYSPELHPVEECWRQLQASLSNRFFDSLDELTTAIDTALAQLSIPNMSNYF